MPIWVPFLWSILWCFCLKRSAYLGLPFLWSILSSIAPSLLWFFFGGFAWFATHSFLFLSCLLSYHFFLLLVLVESSTKLLMLQ
jgi:hypothetical protein